MLHVVCSKGLSTTRAPVNLTFSSNVLHAIGADNEIPSEEFLKAAKKKRRVFNEQINKILDKVCALCCCCCDCVSALIGAQHGSVRS
jgi:hypothetical protein